MSFSWRPEVKIPDTEDVVLRKTIVERIKNTPSRASNDEYFTTCYGFLAKFSYEEFAKIADEINPNKIKNDLIEAFQTLRIPAKTFDNLADMFRNIRLISYGTTYDIAGKLCANVIRRVFNAGKLTLMSTNHYTTSRLETTSISVLRSSSWEDLIVFIGEKCFANSAIKSAILRELNAESMNGIGGVKYYFTDITFEDKKFVTDVVLMEFV